MFNKRIMSGVLAMALASLSGATLAQTVDAATQAKLTELETRFKESDKNADGKLTLQEAKDGHMTRIADAFGHIDTDKKGFVTLDQLKALLIKNAN